MLKPTTKSLLLPAVAAAVLIALPAYAAPLVEDSFAYPDGPLAGNGGWDRGVNEPASDDPSDHIAVQNGAVVFDWTTPGAKNNVVRAIWPADDTVQTGMIFAIFDFQASQVPAEERNVRPGFLSFGNGNGSQQRGLVGIQSGSVAGTYRLGISRESQVGTAFSFAQQDLELNTTYKVMIGFDTTTQATKLWIGTTDADSPPAVEIPGSGSNNGIRRVNLRLYNSDGGGSTTNLGIFQIQNLAVTTAP